MLQLNTIVNVIDNTGAKKILYIQKLKRRSSAYLQVFRGVVKKTFGKRVIPKGQKVICALVRSRKSPKPFRTSENACIILNENYEPISSRIFGPIIRLKKNSNRRNLQVLKGITKVYEI